VFVCYLDAVPAHEVRFRLKKKSERARRYGEIETD
jgi:hypothetical protein